MSSAEPPPGGNDAASQSHRYFCRHCSTTVILHPSAGSTLLCPICQGGRLTQESDTPSSSSTTSSRPLNPDAPPSSSPSPPPTPGVITRRATFELRHPTDTYVRVISESNFFRDPLADSAPILIPLPAAGSIIPFRFFSDFLDYCFNEGAIINSTLLHDEIIEIFHSYVSLHLLSSAPRYDVALLPDISMTEDLLLASGDARCPVCIEDFKIGEEAKQLPCKHVYHRDCIAPWLERHDTCPVCRFILTTAQNPRSEPQGGAGDPPTVVSGVSGEGIAGSGEQIENIVWQSMSDSMVTRFDIELQWPVEASFSRFESGSSENGGGSGEGNGEDSDGNEPSTPEEPESGHG